MTTTPTTAEAAPRTGFPPFGAHPNMGREEYHALPYPPNGPMSKSYLWSMVLHCAEGRPLTLSPKLLHYYTHHGFPKHEGQEEGNAVHTLALEGESAFSERFWKAEQCQATIESKNSPNKGKQCDKWGIGIVDGEWRCGTHKGSPDSIPAEVEVLSGDMLGQVRGMAGSLQESPRVQQLLRSGQAETPLFEECPITGFPLKGCVDWLILGDDWASPVDIKTTRAANLGAFYRDIIKLGYHVQLGAGYAHLIRAVYGVKHIYPTIIGVRKSRYSGVKGKHPVWVIPFDEGTMRLAEQHYEQLTTTLMDCLERDDWWEPDHLCDPPNARPIQEPESW